MSKPQAVLMPASARVQIEARRQVLCESTNWDDIVTAQESETVVIAQPSWNNIPFGKVTALGKGLNVLFFQDKETGAPDNRLNAAIVLPLLKQLPRGDRDMILRAVGESAVNPRAVPTPRVAGNRPRPRADRPKRHGDQEVPPAAGEPQANPAAKKAASSKRKGGRKSKPTGPPQKQVTKTTASEREARKEVSKCRSALISAIAEQGLAKGASVRDLPESDARKGVLLPFLTQLQSAVDVKKDIPGMPKFSISAKFAAALRSSAHF
jgi:hypothetical protein